jgi:hypothetical protein
MGELVAVADQFERAAREGEGAEQPEAGSMVG